MGGLGDNLNIGQVAESRSPKLRLEQGNQIGWRRAVDPKLIGLSACIHIGGVEDQPATGTQQIQKLRTNFGQMSWHSGMMHWQIL